MVSGKAYTVKAHYVRWISVHNDKRTYVLNNLGHTTYHGYGTNLDELMDSGHSADNSMGFHRYVACQPGEAGNDNIISQITVMSYMYIGLKHIVRANMGFLIFTGCAVDGAVFADTVGVTYDYGAVFSMIFQVLRFFPDYGMRENMIILSHAGMGTDNDMCVDAGTFTDFTARSDYCIWTDNNIL